MSERLDPDAAREILRRAVEIESERRAGTPDIEREALEQAAAEVGISPDAVRRAVAEHGVGAIPVPVHPRSMLGAIDVRAVAVIDRPTAQVDTIVKRWLTSQTLAVSRRSGSTTEWTRRNDMVAKVRRKVDLTKRIRLDQVDRVIVSVGDSGDGRTLLRIEADLENTRRGLRTGAVGAPTIGAPIAFGIVAVFTEPWLFLAGFPAGAALGSAGLYLARKTLAQARDEAQRVIDLFVAELG